MRSPLKKITIAFIAIALLPIGFMIYELGLLNKNELIVRETYQNQLDAILYSVNQYSDDIISSWANRVRLEMNKVHETETDWSEQFNKVIEQNGVVRYVYFSDRKGHSVIYSLSEKDSSTTGAKQAMDKIIRNESDRVGRLIEYEQSGFRKMEAVDAIVEGNSIAILFALGSTITDYQIGAIVIDLPVFINNNLGPKMQEISQGKFIISALTVKNDSVIYSTEVNQSPDVVVQTAQALKSEIQKKDFWILPGYYLGITLKGATIDDLVKARTGTSLTILTILIVILASGLFFLYNNIRKEIQLSQAKSEFVSNVSHEIRTPLSLIGMFAETLDAGRVTTEEKKKEYYGIISKETARLSRIVNRILNFSQMDANKKRFNFAPLQLNDLCKEILETYFYHLEDKGFTFKFEPSEDLGKIYGDRESISEAIINLLDNAIKYSGDRKHIVLRTGRDHNFRFVEVIDQGIGIARKHHHEIFEQFFRAPTGDIHTTKGSGLGLTLVRKIMEAHHGQVTVDSSPGKGSTFRLKFPVQKEEMS
jgi:two-component system phosphate regulon sensor histidine kinase PhoR